MTETNRLNKIIELQEKIISNQEEMIAILKGQQEVTIPSVWEDRDFKPSTMTVSAWNEEPQGQKIKEGGARKK